MAFLSVKGNQLTCGNLQFRCAVGKSGFSAHKKEGDGCTPLGAFPLRECWYRADRLSAPETALPLRVIKENDGWCDDPASKEYNRHIKVTGDRLQVTAKKSLLKAETCNLKPSFEYLRRDDHVYDLIIPIGYNDDPVVPGIGSAIFLHLAHEDYRPTEGCVALAKEDLLTLLLHLDTNSVIEIRP